MRHRAVSSEGMQSSTRPGRAEEYSHRRSCDQCKSRQIDMLYEGGS